MATTDVQSGDLFFFYGLLKKDASGMPAHIDLDAGGRFLEPATLRGDLYDLGGYPGIVDGSGLVRGVLYRLDDVTLTGPLDEFEDYTPDDPDASLYLRIRRELLDPEGMPTGELAWVYWYNKTVTGLAKLADGIWPLDRGRRVKGT